MFRNCGLVDRPDCFRANRCNYRGHWIFSPVSWLVIAKVRETVFPTINPCMTQPFLNALHREHSPYLRQHATNPVQWLSWGEGAFKQAQSENKPILLSIGYAACHWCHVMARESFEDVEVADLMNKYFVNVKVDREERPDVDAVYIQALQAMGKRPGWPLTMFLTPKGEPFWGGTYFPPVGREGLPAFRDVLKHINDVYRSDPATVKERAGRVIASLVESSRIASDEDQPQHTNVIEAAEELLSNIDMEYGGIKGAPKFPYPPLLRFLWNTGCRLRREDFQYAITLTLDKMIQGGIYDHIGGGFARYSVDANWMIPHFEKMLYDNVQLVSLFTDVWRVTRLRRYEDCVRQTTEWLLREMRLPEGGFASSLAAEGNGGEGAFYVWTEEEVDRLLGEKAARFKQAYGITPTGNFGGSNVLNRLTAPPGPAEAQESEVAVCREVLFRARSNRMPPRRDEKVLADWNGLAISALAKAAVSFQQRVWLDAAEKAFEFVTTSLVQEGELVHSWCDGHLGSATILDDYANTARAALVLFELTGERNYLEQCKEWAKRCTVRFGDPESGAFYFTAGSTQSMPGRICDGRDTVTPAGNGVMAEVLARLYYLTGSDHYRHQAQAIFRAFARDIRKESFLFATILDAQQLVASGKQIVIVGNVNDPETQELCTTAHQYGGPDSVVMMVESGIPLPPQHPASRKEAVEGRPTAYLCVGTTCSLPARDAMTLRAFFARL
jgi:uncharacterized protein YyaL (SSP411 family)